ncbi:fibronectin type III domain-containing protein [bacterium]|nr:fibronectin type III domain-containing protein [bacterium]
MTSVTNNRGFTLIEVAIGLVIAALLTFGIFRIFQTTSESFDRGTENIDGQQNARAALDWIARELRGAKGFTLAQADEVTFLSDRNVPNQIRTFRLDTDDDDGDGDTSELLLTRNPDDDGTPGVFTDEIAIGIESLLFTYRDGNGNPTTSRAAVQEVEVAVIAQAHRMGMEEGEAREGAREVGMGTRVRCRNLGKSVPTLGDAVPPGAPTGLNVVMSCGTATLSWSANSETDLAGYYLAYDRGSGGSPYEGTDANQGPSPIYVGNSTSYTLTGLDLSSTYYFNLQAVDAADNVGGWGSEVSGVPSDVVPPIPPSNVLGRVVENDAIYLAWTASPEWDVTGYRVKYVGDDDPTAVNTVDTTVPSTRISGLNASATYAFTVIAIDGCGNESLPSTPIVITLIPCDQDVTFPEIPEGVSVAPGDGFVRVSWTRVPDTDVIGYQVYFERESSNGSTLMVGDVNTFTIHGLENGTSYGFQVAAMDGCGHVGGFSGMQNATPVQCANSLPPSAPANVTATDLGTGDEVSLSWTVSSDNDVLGYTVYWGPSPGSYTNSEDVGNTIFRTVSGLAAGSPVYFTVTAYDACGEESAYAVEASATPGWGCLCPPVATTDSPADYAVVGGMVPWTVTATACSTATIDYVEFVVDGTTKYVDYTAPYQYGDFALGWDTIFETDGPHLLVARAADNAGCIASDSTSVYVDNSGAGVPCVGFEDGEVATLEGMFSETVVVDVVNLSSVKTYDMSAVVLDWSASGLVTTRLYMDAVPVWTAPGAGGASGDTLLLSSPATLAPGGRVTMSVDFWDSPSTPAPDLKLELAGMEATFLGDPTAQCGPYVVPINAGPCDPGVTIKSVTSSNSYDVFGEPETGDVYYTDRTYTLTYLPDELNGSTLVRTPNNDKNAGSSLELKLNTIEATTVYIAYDPRGTPPTWIRNNYTDTGLTIGVTDSGTSTLGLWRRNLGAGDQSFFGNKASGWGGGVGTNYVIFVKCQEASS